MTHLYGCYQSSYSGESGKEVALERLDGVAVNGVFQMVEMISEPW